MSSFINFNNKEVTTGTSYTAEAVKLALLKSETKSPIKAEALTKNIKEPLSLNEALVFFTDKLSAMKSLSLANAEINEGKIKQFEADYKDMESNIKRGIGWIDPEYVGDTWENSSDSIDFELVKTELYKRLIAAGLLAFSNPEDGETKGVPVRSLKDLSIKESLEADKVNETLFFAFFNNKKIEVEGKDLWDAKQKAIIELKVPKSKIGYLAVVSAESQKNQDFKFESFVNESEVETIELDMAWDSSSAEDDKAAKAAFKKYKIKVKGANGQPGTYEVTGKKKDILAYLKSDFYEMDQETIEEYYPELLESAKKPAGLTLDDTKKVAELYASALSKADGVKATVNKKSLEEDSFDLDVDGEEYAGGSYNIYHNGEVVNHAVPGSPIYGYFDDKLDTIVKNIKNPKLHESAMSDIDIMAQEAKDFKSFVKEFKKEHHDLSKSGEPGQFEAWLQTIYDTAKENMDESVVNEGQFSWMAQDTGNQIGSEKQNTIAVTMFDDKGNKWEEKSYDGYGEFGGKDYYELLAQMNGIENPNRQDGIDIAFDKKKVKGKVLFPALVEDPKRFNFKKHDFTQEAESDPNQSWYQEEEYDDDYEEYDESVVTEAARVPSNVLDFAKRKGSYATSLVKKAATWAEKAGKYISGGTAIGKDYMTIILDMKHQGSEIYINLDDETIELFGEEVTDAKSFQKVLDANMSESVVNESAADLIKYVETISEKTFKGGGNGQNLLDNAMELASHIGDYEMGRPTRGYEEDGFYGPATVTLFKRLVDQMSADDIKNNQADKYESVVIEGISVTDERVYGKKGIIIMIDDNGKQVSAIFKDKKNADKYNRNKAEDIKALLDLAKDTKYPNAIDESVVNEGRSINKIQKEWSETTTKMQQKAGDWKVAEGDRKSELLDEMKALTAKKRQLEAELDAAVAGKDKDLELVVSEGNAFGAARAKAIADGEKEFEFEGETYKVEDVGPDDKENAEEFVEESKLTLDALVEMFEVKVNEDLRSDVKKFIKDNASELNTLADKDEWDLMYTKLYSEFNVEADSTKGKDLLKTFQFVF